MTQKGLMDDGDGAKVPVAIPTIGALAIPDEKLMEMLRAQAAEMGDMFRFPAIKIDHKGLSPFKLPSGEVIDYVCCAILGGQRYKARWSTEEKAPLCVSHDMVKSADGQDCIPCRFNKFGSDPKGGKGKACKDGYRMYLMIQGEVLPCTLDVPPTSLRSWSDYLTSLLAKKLPKETVYTRIEFVKNSSGSNTWVTLTFSNERILTQDEFNAANKFRETFASLIRANVSFDDAKSEPSTAEVKNDDEVPF